MNEHDSERLAGLLEADGLVPATDIDDADVVVVNTCCIRENADNRLYGQLGHLKSVKDRRPGMQIAVGGCLAQKDRDLVRARAPWVDAVWGTHNVGRAAELLALARTGAPVTEILDEADGSAELFPSALPVRREQGWAAWITIQVGCDNKCAFCIVPAVRGPEVSRPFGQIVDEVADLARAGTVEVTLLGQNVNSYGRDLTSARRSDPQWMDSPAVTGPAWADAERPRARPLFADLLETVARIPGIRRVRYTSPHPKDLRPETIAAMASEAAVCPHLHFPLQSGSDRILAQMHRGYDAERYLAKLAAARAGIDDLAVTTDIIVGFPGETDIDFARTLEVAAAAAYDSAFTFIYSPRAGTEASARSDQVAPEVIAERFERLRVVVERSALAKHQAREGRIEEVVVEGPSKRNPKVLSGRTAQGKLVHFPPGEGQVLLAGSFADVKILRGAPHFLTGELLEVTAMPTHRRRLPVSAA